MLPVLLFSALWAVLGIGVFYLAVRRGPGALRAALRRPSRAARTATGWLFFVTYVGFGLVLPAVFLIGNHDNASGQVGGIKLTAADKRGRELFGEHCGVCHTLAAANAIGKVGPNLDTLQPAKSLVIHTITYGCLQNPPSPSSPQTCLGQGTMPASIVQGRDAEDIADFVSKVAGKE